MVIIFDLDGTLFQTDVCVCNALNKLSDELGIERIEQKLIKSRIGLRTEAFLRELLPLNIYVTAIAERFRMLERDEVKQNGILFPNTKSVLENLKTKGHRLMICSCGSREYISLVLRKTKIIDCFDCVYSASEYQSKTEALADIVRYEKQAVYVGDTAEDATAADNNDIPFIGALYGYGFEGKLSNALFCIEHISQLISCTAQIEVFHKLLRIMQDRKWRVVGVNGVDTSGKTAFSDKFARFLLASGIKCVVVHIDDYHNPIEIRRQGANEIEAYYYNAFNVRQLTDELLLPIRNGSVRKTVVCLDLETNRYDKPIYYSIDEDTVVIIEGVLLFRPPIIEFLDGKVFLDVDFETVIARARQRDVPKYGEAFLQRYYDKYIPIQKLYFEHCSPKESSDVVIDNNDFNYPVLRLPIEPDAGLAE